jgi:hypothetical protein
VHTAQQNPLQLVGRNTSWSRVGNGVDDALFENTLTSVLTRTEKKDVPQCPPGPTCKCRRRVGVPADLDKLDAERVGMVWACFDLIPGLDEHLGELVARRQSKSCE